MQVQVTGKHVDVGEALRTRVSDELSSSIGKYFDRDGGGADVVVSREGHAFRVDCAVTLASGQQLTPTAWAATRTWPSTRPSPRSRRASAATSAG